MKSDLALLGAFIVLVFGFLIWLFLASVKDRNQQTSECEARGGVLVLDAERRYACVQKLRVAAKEPAGG